MWTVEIVLGLMRWAIAAFGKGMSKLGLIIIGDRKEGRLKFLATTILRLTVDLNWGQFRFKLGGESYEIQAKFHELHTLLYK
jgi:hypothetical protein